MTNILHLIDTAGPGGGETVLLNLVKRLDSTRWRPVVVVPERDWLYFQLKEIGVEPILLRSRVRFDRAYIGALMRVVRDNNVGLIHSHFFGPTVTASLLGMMLRVPVVGTLHGEGDLHPQERFRRLKFAIVNYGARRVVAVSEPLRRFFLKAGRLKEERTEVIPNGVEVAPLLCPDRSLREALGIGNEEFVIGAVGNLRPAKAYDTLLHAAALLRRHAETFRVVIVGQTGGELYEALLALRSRLGLDDHVVFAGFRNDVSAAMASFDLYVLSSRTEGFSLSTVEAMGAGLPVVATRCGGPETILEDGTTGLLVENGSPPAVADGIVQLWKNPEVRRKMGEAGRRLALQRYTLDVQVQRYERLYDECMVGASRIAVDRGPIHSATAS